MLVRRKEAQIFGPNGDLVRFRLERPGISLFTGAGGMDIGLEQAGFDTVVQHEWDRDACDTLIMNRPNYFRNSALIQGDLRKTPTEMILDAGGLRVGEAEIVAGGPPCQGFSSMNSKAVKHIADERNDLVFEFLRVIREAMPRHFIFENVPGFVRFNQTKYMASFLHAAYNDFFELVYGLVQCAEYGVPQNRVRFLCMGTRRDVFRSEGYLASLPSPLNFGKKDLSFLVNCQGTPLFDDEVRLLTQAPGIRYFPNRPVLVPPSPSTTLEEGLNRSKTFIEFYRQLEKEEPDRIVKSSNDEAQSQSLV